MKTSWRDMSIALAGVLQAVGQVEQIATTGYVKTDEFETAIRSLFVTQPNSTIEPFTEVAKLLSGLESLEEMLSDYRQSSGKDAFRYALGVIHLQKKLTKNPKLLSTISERLEHAEHQTTHFGFVHDNVISNIASIYTDTISTFQYRIQVKGNFNYLQQERVANQVRALLLAAIRAAMLWRQLGGSRWHFVAHRSAIHEACSELLKEAKHAIVH